MRYNRDLHHRQSIRLRGFDYTQPGAYFITVCTHERAPLFGDVVDGAMVLSAAGAMVETCWYAIPDHFPWVRLDAFVVMPNHVHGIVLIDRHEMGIVGANDHSPLPAGTTRSLGSVVRGFKIGVTKWFHANTDVHAVWQRNYYEHIIRHEQAYAAIADYIRHNPQRWQDDVYCVAAGRMCD